MDVLWMGTPLVTRPGEIFSSRVAASICVAMGMPHLVTRNAQDYRRVVLALISKQGGRDRLHRIRREAESRRWSSQLFDTDIGVRRLERASRMMWEVKAAGLPAYHVILMP
mmetsp:Transcript_35943/g.56075  ORF Transcript_35943/g.56075 Transcript_35943/m.56075 type:complete len:111 (-) Transcript_35943:20-352(-)